MKGLKFAAVAAMASVMTLGAETLDCGDFARNWKVHQWEGFIPFARFATDNGVLSIRGANARSGAGYTGPRFKCNAGDIVHLRYEMRGKGKGAAWLQLLTRDGRANGCLAEKKFDLTEEWKPVEVTVSIENGADGETGAVGLCCGCTKGSEADFRNFSCEIDRCFFDDFEGDRKRAVAPSIVTRDIAPGLLAKTKMGSYRTAGMLDIPLGSGSFKLPEADEVNPYLEFGLRPYDILGGKLECRMAGLKSLVIEAKGGQLIASFAGKKLEMPYGTLPADFLLRVSKTGAFDLTVKSLSDSSTHAMKGECDALKGRSEPVTAALRLVRTAGDEAELVVDNLRAGRASLKSAPAPAPIRIERAKSFDPRKAGWPLVFEDDFSGGEIDRSKWYHWNSKVWPERAFVTNGLLHILCDWDKKHEHLTTASLWSTKAQKYGFFEARVKFTKKRGWWAAFWLYGDSDGNPFADGFEIDGFEDYYTRPRDRSKPNEPILDHNLHINNGKHLKSWNYNSRLPGSLDDFYTIGVKWTPFEISYYLDGKLISSKSTHSNYDSVTFDAVTHAAGITPLHAIVSGQIMKDSYWATDVDGEIFPDHYLVDYVRIYAYPEDAAGTPAVKLEADDADRVFVKPGEKLHFKAEVSPAVAGGAPIKTVYLFDDGYLLDYRSEPPYEFDVTFSRKYFDETAFAKAGRSGLRRELDNHPHYFVAFAQDEKGRVGQSGKILRVMAESEKAKPFEGKAQQLPGKLVIGRFDEGGNGVGWHDQTPADNSCGGNWRPREGVDATEHSVGSVNAGEWLNYTVDVRQDGYYKATFSYGSPLRDPFTAALVCDGRLLGRFKCKGHDQDGSWQIDSTAVLSKLPIKAGRHQLSIVLEGRCNFGDIEFELEDPNLLLNPALERNAAGKVKNWNYHYEGEVYRNLIASEEDGRGIVTIEPHKGFLGLNQNGITVIPGNKYRIGAWVRTKGVKAKRTGILLYNWAWVGEAGFNAIPADTKGEWVKLEKTIEAMESSKGIWVMTLFSIDQTEGRIDLREPFLEPVAPVDSPCECPAVAFEDLHVITPINPLLARVPEKNAEMTFAYRYDLPRDAKDAEITAYLKLAGEKEFGHVASAKLAGQHASVKFGDLKIGDGRLKVQLRVAGRTLAENEYPISVVAAVETGSPVKLNEQVQRLAKTAAKDGEIDFIAPKDGWVWMKLDRYDGETRIYLDGGERPVAHYRRLAPGFEAMHRVKAGRHTLRLAGTVGGELTVNAIPELGVYSYPAKYYPAMEGYRPYSTDEFKARWLYPNLNHFSNGYDVMDKQDRADVADYGFSYLRQACAWTKNIKGWECRWEMPEEMSRRFIAHGCPPGDYRYGVTFDEIDLGHTREQWNLAQCSRLLWDAPKPLYVWHSGRCLRETGLDAEYVSAIANNSRGSGRFLFELYPTPPDNEAEAAEYLKKELFSDPIGRMKRLMPAAISNTMVFAGCYIRPETNCYGCQNGEDMKAFYDMYFRILATDPEFAGLAGVGLYSYVNGDEELLRWSMTLFHHYFIEGRTESLAAKYGYLYRPELLTNGDFDEGLAGWEARAAESGSLEVVKVDGFKRRVTIRKSGKAKGDELCRFRRSEKGANRLERQLTGLKRGEYYALRYIVADAKTSSKEDFAKAEKREYPLAATIEGARDVTTDTHAVDCGMNRRILKGKNAVTIVFKAVSDRAKVVFDDTAAKPGEELLLGCVRVAPYFFEK